MSRLSLDAVTTASLSCRATKSPYHIHAPTYICTRNKVQCSKYSLTQMALFLSRRRPETRKRKRWKGRCVESTNARYSWVAYLQTAMQFNRTCVTCRYITAVRRHRRRFPFGGWSRRIVFRIAKRKLKRATPPPEAEEAWWTWRNSSR